MTKKIVIVEVHSGSRNDGSWPPQDPAGFMAWFHERISSIPEEYRSAAIIELGTAGDFEDSVSAFIEITYLRTETDEQYASRLLREEELAAKRAAAQERQERLALAALLKKYGPPTG